MRRRSSRHADSPGPPLFRRYRYSSFAAILLGVREMCMKELSRFAVLFGLLMPASVACAQPAPRPLCSGTVDAQLLCLNVLVGELLADRTVMQSGNQPMPPADDWGERENV